MGDEKDSVASSNTELQKQQEEALWDAFSANNIMRFRGLLDSSNLETQSIVMKRIMDTHGQAKALAWALRNNTQEIIEIVLNLIPESDKNNLILEVLTQLTLGDEDQFLKQALHSKNTEIIQAAFRAFPDAEKSPWVQKELEAQKLEKKMQEDLWDAFSTNNIMRFRELLYSSDSETQSFVMRKIRDTHGQARALAWALRNNVPEIIEMVLNFLPESNKNSLILEALNQLALKDGGNIVKKALRSKNAAIIKAAFNALPADDAEKNTLVEKAVIEAVEQQDVFMLKCILDALSEAEIIALLNKTITNTTHTLLTFTALCGYTEILKTLLYTLPEAARAAALNQREKAQGCTPIMCAIYNEHVNALEAMLDSLPNKQAKSDAIHQETLGGFRIYDMAMATKNTSIINIAISALLNEEQENLRKNAMDQLLLRLEIAKTRPLSEELSKVLSRAAFIEIINYFLINQDEELSAQLNDDEKKKNQAHLDKIVTLKRGEAYRLAKESSGLPRTVNILCGVDGELQLIVETKSKLADDTKQQLLIKKGAYKTGKPAWRIDSEEAQLFNLVTRPEGESDIKNVRAEVDISRKMVSTEVAEYQLGVLFHDKRTGKAKISVYAVMAEANLEDVLSSKIYPLSQNQKDSLILDLVKGVKTFHDKGYVHQDLKPNNALVYGNATEGYHLKLIDFGLTQKQGDSTKEPLATATHVSPEIAYYFSAPNSSQYSYFSASNCGDTLGYQLYKAKENAKLFPEDGSKRGALSDPDTANDMWALGIVIFQIQHKGRLPTMRDLREIQGDPLLKGLLNPDRSQIDTALQIHQAKIAQTLQKPTAAPVIFSEKSSKQPSTPPVSPEPEKHTHPKNPTA